MFLDFLDSVRNHRNNLVHTRTQRKQTLEYIILSKTIKLSIVNSELRKITKIAAITLCDYNLKWQMQVELEDYKVNGNLKHKK